MLQRILFTILFFAFAQLTVQAKTFTLTVLDESGKPIPKAKFYYQASPKPKDWNNIRINTQTDDNGQSVVSFDSDVPLKNFVVSVKTPGYTPFYANWDNPLTDPIPDAYTITIQKAVTVGGFVVDPDGKPVAGADVDYTLMYEAQQMRAWREIGSSGGGKTDADGLWKYESLPPDRLNINRKITVTHKDFSPFQLVVQLTDLLPQDDGSFKTTFRLEHGITVKGCVTDSDGKPIADAAVVGRNIYRNGMGDETVTKTDAKGEYVLKNWIPSRDAYIGVWKAGMMAAMESLPSFNKENPPTVNFVLKPAGKPITVRIIDKDGKPIQGFYIAIERWKDQRMPSGLFLTGKESRPRTDAEGRWTWKEAPEEGVMFDMFFSDQYMEVREQPVAARDEEYVFMAGEPLNITGNVMDAETGKAVPTFNVFWGRIPINGDEMYWSAENGAGSGGKYQLRSNFSMAKPVGVKIEADGYEPVISREINTNEGHITIDFAMKKLSADQVGIHGMVLLPNGKPAEKATVAIATLQGSVNIKEGGKVQSYGERQPVFTNAEGQFKFPYIDFEAEAEGRFQPQSGVEKTDFILVAVHNTGFKRISQQDWNVLGETKTITLEPWGRIEGTVKQGTLPGKYLPVACTITFRDEEEEESRRAGFYRIEPHVFADYNAIADESGKFVFDRVPPAVVRAGRLIIFNNSGSGYAQMYSHTTDELALKPGETRSVTIGGIGRPVTGKLVPAEEFETSPDWRFSHIECMPVLEENHYPDLTELRNKMVPKEILDEKDTQKAKEWLETEEGKRFKSAAEEATKDYSEIQKRNEAKRAKQRVCAVADDGTFRLDDMFAGDWQLTVQLVAPPPAGESCGVGGQIGKLVYQFTVPVIEGDVSDEPMDLGSLTVEKLVPEMPMPTIGAAAPNFEIVKIEPLAEDGKYEDKGEKLRLSDYKGKYVILDFWAMWCGPCLAKVPELQKLYEKIKDNERFVMIGLSLDGDKSEERLGKFIVNRQMPWLHGLAGDWNGNAVRSYGVRAIPAMMLIDPEGKVMLSNPELPVLVKKIEELL